MGRRRGFFAELEHQRNLRVQQAAREQRERDRLIAQTKRERERLARAAAQADKQAAKEAAAEYLQVRQAEVVALNHALTERIAELDDLLVGSLRRSARIPFAALRRQPEIPRFTPGQDGTPTPPPSWQEFAPPPASAVQRMFKKQSVERTILQRQAEFANAQAQHQAAETNRLQRLAEAQRAYRAGVEAERQRTDEANAKVDAFEQAYRQGRPEAVNDYVELTLESRPLPVGFPTDVEVAYQPEIRRLLVVMELPTVEVIPPETEFRYVRAKDEITPKARPA
ncbi:hypothetical protein AB0E63_00810 [Kribbella sp. NPDC026596]|uniref:hypothetical protein n=1 Tax=Kribbella sp. NPDC026596 TaxID=3155122 RepID=UPI0033D38F12